MKKAFCFLFILLTISAFSINKPACAKNWGYKYIDSGYFYSDVTLPFDAKKEGHVEENNIVPVSQSEYKALKKGTSSRTNILGLVEYGDAGIFKAAKDGRINKIHYIEVTREKLFLPLVWIPIYYDRYITTVYGE
ncbi:MAG: TRL-like family protein [Bacillus subtilis]|nr:TRL-like family protein [Bacillus subtilis]